ncbi:hypothetical protein [Streptomyces sp. NPDC005374]|uniref:hypothetical protein n=1 Tax=Streptomyces sp. NPDC005374 TaxID=3364713 RepID=UPI0036941202
MRAALRVPAVLMTVVIGTAGAVSCSRSDSGTAAPDRTKASAPHPEPSRARTAPRAADLPKHAVTSDKRPTFGAADTMAAGYTGKDFLAGLSKDWKLKLDKPVGQEMPDGKKRTYVNGHGGDGGDGMTVSAGYIDNENMSSLLCRTGTDQSDGFDFLAACTGLDVAGVDHGKASSWLKQAKQETDSLYAEKIAETGNKKEYVVSGVFTSGPVVMILHRAYDKYSLRILGGAVA